MAITFEVGDVEQGTERLTTVAIPRAILGQLDGRAKLASFEASSADEIQVHATPINPFVAAVRLAFDHHLPLTLSPDQVWILLAQGFATHVRENAEALRERFVQHQGKLKISIIRDDFVRGGPNPWPELFGDFEAALRSKIGKLCDLVVADFSTTGSLERAVSQLVLMDAIQAYFSFEFRTRCGIPRVTLTGTPADWRSVRTRAEVFAEYELDWWLVALRPILDEFVHASEGRVNEQHWRSIYGTFEMSGGPYITGWLPVLCPYLINGKSEVVRNRYLGREGGHGPVAEMFPKGLSKISVVWDYFGERIDMEFLGGFAGVRQDPETLELSPHLGWATRYTGRT